MIYLDTLYNDDRESRLRMGEGGEDYDERLNIWLNERLDNIPGSRLKIVEESQVTEVKRKVKESTSKRR